MQRSLIESSFFPDLTKFVRTPNPTSSSLSSNRMPAHILSLVRTEPLVPRKVSFGMRYVIERRVFGFVLNQFLQISTEMSRRVERSARRGIHGANALSKQTKTAY